MNETNCLHMIRRQWLLVVRAGRQAGWRLVTTLALRKRVLITVQVAPCAAQTASMAEVRPVVPSWIPYVTAPRSRNLFASC